MYKHSYVSCRTHAYRQATKLLVKSTASAIHLWYQNSQKSSLYLSHIPDLLAS